MRRTRLTRDGEKKKNRTEFLLLPILPKLRRSHTRPGKGKKKKKKEEEEKENENVALSPTLNAKQQKKRRSQEKGKKDTLAAAVAASAVPVAVVAAAGRRVHLDVVEEEEEEEEEYEEEVAEGGRGGWESERERPRGSVTCPPQQIELGILLLLLPEQKRDEKDEQRRRRRSKCARQTPGERDPVLSGEKDLSLSFSVVANTGVLQSHFLFFFFFACPQNCRW